MKCVSVVVGDHLDVSLAVEGIFGRLEVVDQFGTGKTGTFTVGQMEVQATINDSLYL